MKKKGKCKKCQKELKDMQRKIADLEKQVQSQQQFLNNAMISGSKVSGQYPDSIKRRITIC